MTWKPTYLTREQMEERRLEGGRLLKAGKMSKAEISRQLGVSRATVGDWAKIIEAKGIRGLRKQKAAGSASKLSNPQKQKLKKRLDRGALACGFPTDRWTLDRVQKLIKKEFEVTYHPNYLNRLLRNLGFSPQKPLAQAVEQEKELVEAWLQKDWPRIKKVTAARRKNRVLG
jgi:transposase